MSRRQWILLAVLALLAALAGWAAVALRQAPRLPADETHARFEGPAACLACHGPDGPAPRGPDHPLGDECLRCHGTRTEDAVSR